MGSSASKPQASPLSNEKAASAGPPATSKDASAAALLSKLSAMNLEGRSSDAHNKEISVSQLGPWESAVSESASYRLARTVLSKTPFQDALLRSELVPVDRHIFNLKIPNEATKVTNQQASGRCWL